MTLSEAEIALLERFAVAAGRTPRQAIRFINIYRIIKSSLTAQLREELNLERGGSLKGICLLPQLAIVTGAPRAERAYFAKLRSTDESLNLTDFIKALEKDPDFSATSQSQIVLAVLTTLAGIDKKRPDRAVICVGDLLYLAPTVRRYSFASSESTH